MPKYSWKCHVCDMTNDQNTEMCSKCGFPASATGRQIEKARLGPTPAENPSVLESFLKDEAVAPLSTTKKFVVGFSIMFGGIGLIIVKAAVTMQWIVAGLALAAVGLFVAVIAAQKNS